MHRQCVNLLLLLLLLLLLFSNTNFKNYLHLITVFLRLFSINSGISNLLVINYLLKILGKKIIQNNKYNLLER